MSVRISFTFEASEMFLSLHMIFSLERAAVVWAILERISGFDPSLEMIAPRYFKFVITFVLSGPISILYLVVVLSRRSIRMPASSSSSAFTTMSSAKRTPLSNSYCSSEPFSCAAIEQECTLGLVKQIFNGSYDAGIDVVFPHSCL